MRIAEMVLAGRPDDVAIGWLRTADSLAGGDSRIAAGGGGRATGARVLSLTIEAAGMSPAAREVSLCFRGGFDLRLAPPSGEPGRSVTVDHVTVCVYPENLERYAQSLCDAFPDARWERLEVGAGESGMRIAAVEDEASGVHVVLAAPKGRAGQVADFLAVTGCEGLQHVAYAVTSVQETLGLLRGSGLRFVGSTPECAESAIIELREQGRWLRQAFTEPLWGEYFVEILERNGIAGLHTGNIQSLYDMNELRRQAISAVPAPH